MASGQVILLQVLIDENITVMTRPTNAKTAVRAPFSDTASNEWK